jgi:type VI secretion system protein ImpJ
MKNGAMQKHKLARVRWQMGQTLLPEHFLIQEESLEAELRLRVELSGLPSYGVGRLSWNETLLAQGSLSITSLTAVMPGGELVDVPGNATLQPFSLEGTGKSSVSVYLHLLAEPRSAEGIALYTNDPPVVQRTIHRLHLSLEPVIDGAVATLKLAVLTKNMEGVWRLEGSWVPPLLLVGSNPFLDELLGDLDVLLEHAHHLLLTQVADSYLRIGRLNNARRTLCEVYRLQAMRADMKRHVYPHPYHLFEALRRLYFEQSCYLEALPDERMPFYQHDDLVQSLGAWMRLLSPGFRHEDIGSSHQPFIYRDGLFVLSPFPSEVQAAGETYLLVQRKEPGEKLPMEGVKLASPSRLPVVRRLALKGIPLRPIPYPNFPHAFSQEIDWYQLAHAEEWQYALRENGVAFYATPALDGSKISLYWRKA